MGEETGQKRRGQRLRKGWGRGVVERFGGGATVLTRQVAAVAEESLPQMTSHPVSAVHRSSPAHRGPDQTTDQTSFRSPHTLIVMFGEYCQDKMKRNMNVRVEKKNCLSSPGSAVVEICQALQLDDSYQNRGRVESIEST